MGRPPRYLRTTSNYCTCVSTPSQVVPGTTRCKRVGRASSRQAELDLFQEQVWGRLVVLTLNLFSEQVRVDAQLVPGTSLG